MSRLRFALLFPLVLVACRGAAAPTDPAAVRREIEANNANAVRWYREGKVDSLAGLFASDVVQLPPNMPPVAGNDSLRAFWRTAFTWGSWEFQLQTQDVVTSGILAVERGRYQLKFTPGPQAPMPATEDRGSYVVYWRRDLDGRWRAVWDAPVSELPPPGAPRR